jgi:hypothetical protein
MQSQEPDKPTNTAQDMPNVEIVAESDLDFENFKKRAEFREQFGGDGELYGRPDDFSSRPGTPSTFTTFTERGPYRHRDATASRASSRTRLGDFEETEDGTGTSYAPGYRPAPPAETGFVDVSIPATPLDADEVLRGTSSRQPLVDSENDGRSGYFGGGLRNEDTSYDRFRSTR